MKTLLYTQLIDIIIACLHKQIDLLRKASFCCAGLSQKDPHPSSRQARGAESRCRLENKQGFTLVQAHDSAEIYRPLRQAWPWAQDKLFWAVAHFTLRLGHSSSTCKSWKPSLISHLVTYSLGRRSWPATGPPFSFWLELWELCFFVQECGLKWNIFPTSGLPSIK